MAKLPPQPIGVAPGSSYWNDWYEKLRLLIEQATTAVINYVDLNFTGSNLTSISTRNHSDLQGLQGGTAGEYYHLTNAQQTDLNAGFTGTGLLVRQTSPSLVTPALGVATATTITTTGNVGIGVAPGARLDVATGTTNRVRLSESASILFWDSLNNAATAWAPYTTRATTINWFTAAAGTPSTGMILSSAGNLSVVGSVTVGSTSLLTSSVALTNGAAAALGTITNAPVAGNPTKWIPINDNGTTRYIPAW